MSRIEPAGPVNSTLSLRGLIVGYRNSSGVSFALGAIDADVAAGQLVCILGPNGSGKSTLLRTIAAFQHPLAGSILLRGKPLERYRENERARLVSVVLTERIDAGMLSAAELVGLGRYPYTSWTGRLTAEDHRAVDRALEAVGALEFARRPVNALSDGERQKVMIARALAQEPRLLLLDEPTAFLDLPRKVEVMELLRSIAHGSGRSVVLSTHELEIAQAVADRLWLVQTSPAGAGAGVPGKGASDPMAIDSSEKRAALVSGAPEDLVLSGDFERLFSVAGARFDRETGRFRFGRRPRRRVIVRGNGVSRHWTERALARIGIEALDERSAERGGEGLPRISVQRETKGLRWTLTRGGTSRVFTSIADLVAELEDEA